MPRGFIATAEILRYTDSGLINSMDGSEPIRTFVETIAFSVDPGTPVSEVYRTVTRHLGGFRDRSDTILNLKLMSDDRIEPDRS